MSTFSSDASGLDQGLHRGALGLSRAIERRHEIEYLESRGFDYPFALFWGGYLAFCAGALIAVVLS